MATSIDVVIVAHERYELMASALRHLEAQTVKHHAIVVDDGSANDICMRLRAEWPAVEVLRLDGRRSLSKARNYGVAAGSSEIVVLLDDDVDCRADFLERLLGPFDDPTVGMVASLLLQSGEEEIEDMGLTSDPVLAGFPRLRGLPIDRAHQRKPLLAGPGASAGAYRRAAWEQVGGFDESLGTGSEDVDLALRLRIAGWTAAAEPKAVGVRIGSDPQGYRSPEQRRQQGFGRGYMLRRYGLLRGHDTPRALVTEAIVVLADLLGSRDMAALRGRLAGWRAGRSCPQLPLPPRGSCDREISLRSSLAMRRGADRRLAA
jgi:N-acetylglucosaminyl-diphospho-decaprenol L-rhamnosyltransferase